LLLSSLIATSRRCSSIVVDNPWTRSARRGQRLTVTEQQTRQAIADAQELCVGITGLTATP
jgi:hypothetical protein